MGAPGQPTARWFQLSLIFIAAGGALVAYAGRDIRSRLRVLRAWAPSVSIWIGCALFFLTSQVTCTVGCPIPIGIAFAWQDFVHTSAAVFAFAAACWGMLQTSFSVGRRALSAFSIIAALSVVLISGAGGLFSLFSFQANLGSRLELIATTIALAWLLVLGVFASARLLIDAVSDAHAAGPDHEWSLDLPEEPITIEGDHGRLHQVIANLLANARVHTPAGTSVSVGLAVDGSDALITVADDGPGIAADLQPVLFERFARGDGSRSRAAGSTGLGLAIVEAVVGGHGGTVSVTSAHGRTEFAVRLPIG